MVWKKIYFFFPFDIWLVCSLFVWNFRCVIILHLAVKKWWTGSVSGSHHLPTAQVSVEYVFKGFLRPWTRRDVERVSWALGSNIYCVPEYWNIPGWHVGHGWTLWCLVNITSCSQRVGCNTIPPLENKGKTLPLLTRGNHWSFEGLILYKHDFHLPKTARGFPQVQKLWLLKTLLPLTNMSYFLWRFNHPDELIHDVTSECHGVFSISNCKLEMHQFLLFAKKFFHVQAWNFSPCFPSIIFAGLTKYSMEESGHGKVCLLVFFCAKNDSKHMLAKLVALAGSEMDSYLPQWSLATW